VNFKRLLAAFFARPQLIVWAAACLVLVMTGVTAVGLYQMRKDALARAVDAAENLALILERDIERNIELYELSMQSVVKGIGEPEVMALPTQIRQRMLFDNSLRAQDLGSILAMDANGDVFLDSAAFPPRTVNLVDRDYFQAQKDGKDDRLFISKPFVPRVTSKDVSIAVSRRLSSKDGQFAGIVAGTLRLNYFHRLFDGVSVGEHGSITFLRTDGTVLMRKPFAEADIGKSIASVPSFPPLLQSDRGTYFGTAALDGTQRLYSFSHIGKYPLIVVVGLGVQDIYATWSLRAWFIAALIVAIDVLIMSMAVAIANEIRKRRGVEAKLEQLANTDGLTGVATRRMLDSTLESEWKDAIRHGRSLSLLMIDVDNFKDFNDIHGHVLGDAALKMVADRITANLRRPSDLAGRYGGEEFCVILPETDLQGAVQVAESIRAAVGHQEVYDLGGKTLPLSVSIGVAAMSGLLAGGLPAQSIVREADERLYEAKAKGKNRVMGPIG